MKHTSYGGPALNLIMQNCGLSAISKVYSGVFDLSIKSG